MTHGYARTVECPGVTVRFMQGSATIEGDKAFFGLRVSQYERAYLENLQPSRSSSQKAKPLEQSAIEEKLDTIIRVNEELESTNEELIVVNRELIDIQDELNDSLSYSDEVIATVREPCMVLNDDLRVQKVNTSNYRKFDVKVEEVEGKHFFEIRKGLWHHDGLKSMMRKVLPEKHKVVDEEITIETKFDGKRMFRFNAREIKRNRESKKLILLEISDITRKKGRRARLSKYRMSALIKNMLNYARLAHHEKLFEPTDFNTVLNDILSDFELLIEQKEAELKISQLPTMEAIPLLVNQLFYNLISNALKFSKEEVSPIISISSRKLSEKGAGENTSLDQTLTYYELLTTTQLERTVTKE